MGFNNPITELSIIDPVNVQGGGELLYSGLVTIADPVGGHWEHLLQVPAPASGLLYWGVRVSFETHAPGTALYGWQLRGDDPGASPWAVGSLAGDSFGLWLAADLHRCTVPVASGYPFHLRLLADTAGATVWVTVEGISAAEPYPRTDLAWLAHNGGDMSVALPGGATSDLYLPASFQPYEVLLQPFSGSLSSTYTYAIDDGLTAQLIGANTHVPAGYAAASPAVAAPNLARVPVRGDGRAKYLRATTAAAAAVRATLFF